MAIMSVKVCSAIQIHTEIVKVKRVVDRAIEEGRTEALVVAGMEGPEICICAYISIGKGEQATGVFYRLCRIAVFWWRVF